MNIVYKTMRIVLLTILLVLQYYDYLISYLYLQ